MEARLTIPSLGYMESPLCAEPESSVPKRHRSDITVGQKREICLYKLQNPAARNGGMALHFSQLYGTSIGRSTIGDIIRQMPHWLSQPDHIVNTTRKISPRHFELEKQLYEFTTEAQGRGMKITDEILLRKAREIGKQVGVPDDFKYSRGWLSNCKKRTNKLIYDDTSVGNSIMVDVGCAEQVIQQLMGNNSTQDAGKQKQKAAKRKRPADEAPSEPELVSCAVCNVSLLTTRGHKHLDDVVHDYSRTPNPANALASKTVRARLEPLLEEPLDGSSWLCSMCYTTLVQLEEYNNLLALYRERHRSTARLQRQLRHSANQSANQDINPGDNRDAMNRESEKEGGPSSKRSKNLKQSTLLQSYMGSLGLARQEEHSPPIDSPSSEPNPQAPSSSSSSPPHEINLDNVIKNILSQQKVNLSSLSVSDTLHNPHLEAVIKKMMEQQQTALTVSSSCSPTSSSSSAELSTKTKTIGRNKKGSCVTAPAMNSEAIVGNVPQMEMETESDDSLSERQPLSPVPHELDGTVDTDSDTLEGGLETLFLRPDGTIINPVWRPWRKDENERDENESDENESDENEAVDETVKSEIVKNELYQNGTVVNETGEDTMDENEIDKSETA